MSTPLEEPRPERPSTYAIEDRNNEEELQRLTVQDHATTHLMGGPLSEQPDPARFTTVLDVGCGTGGWAITLAQQYPWMRVTGIDISGRMISYARQQAEQAGVADRVQFHVMDALSGLALPDHSFDLVNERANFSYIRTWDWHKYLLELRRVARPSGIVRLTEPEIGHSTSPAFTQLLEIIICAGFRAQYFFEPKAIGIIPHLEPMLRQAQYRDIQQCIHEGDISLNSPDPDAQAIVLDLLLVTRTARPFFLKMGCAPTDYDTLYERMQAERQQDYRLSWRYVTFWATTPDRSLRSPTRMKYTLSPAPPVEPPAELEEERTGTSIISPLRPEEPQRLRALHALLPLEQELAAIADLTSLQNDLAQVRLALDVGSGPGDWAIEFAQRFPHLAVGGIDLSRRLTASAQARAQQAGLAERVRFYRMDALSHIPLDEGTYDLVHLRAATSFVRQREWEPLFVELQRLLRPGGLLCLTEAEIALASSSAALCSWCDWLRDLLFQRLYLSAPEPHNITEQLPTLLKRRGVLVLQQRAYPLEYHAGTPAGQAAITYFRLSLTALRPFLTPADKRREEYAALCQQILRDLDDEHFWVRWQMHTIWGLRPSDSLLYREYRQK